MKKSFLFCQYLVLFLTSNYFLIVYANTDHHLGSYVFKDNGTFDKYGGIINAGDFINMHGWQQLAVGNDGLDDAVYSDYNGRRFIRFIGESSINRRYGSFFEGHINSTFTYRFLWNVAFYKGIESSTYIDDSRSSRYIGLIWENSSANFRWLTGGSGVCSSNSDIGSPFSESVNEVWNVSIIFNGTDAICKFNESPCAKSCFYAPDTNFNRVVLNYPQAGIAYQGEIAVYNGTNFPQAESDKIKEPITLLRVILIILSLIAMVLLGLYYLYKLKINLKNKL